MSNRDNIESIVTESFNRNLRERKEEHLFGNIVVYIVEELPQNINLQSVLQKVESVIPQHFMYGIDAIYVEHLDDFDRRDVNAVYKNGSIYVSNDQTDNDDMVDDIIHEIAHSVESLYRTKIYNDKRVVDEFLGKRKRLLDILAQEGYNVSVETFLNPNYSRQLDDFLHKKVGYSLLTTLTQGLFISPYSATSVREYFSIGLEQYFLKDRGYVKKICPQLFSKIVEVSNL